MPPKPFSNNLRFNRKRIGLLQSEVADRLQLDCVNRISRWENGSSVPNIINLFKLAALYGVAPHELYPGIFQSVQKELHGNSTSIDASAAFGVPCPENKKPPQNIRRPGESDHFLEADKPIW